jgi:hypothetical protein
MRTRSRQILPLSLFPLFHPLLPSLPSPISHNLTEAIAYLQSQGLTMLKSYWVNTSSVDADALTKDLRVAIRDQLANISADESFSFSFYWER